PYGEADVLLGMEAIETLRNIEFVKSGSDIILNNYIWQPVQSTYERVNNSEQQYITIESITEQLKNVTEKIHIIGALELANIAGNPLTSNVILLGALAMTDGFPIKIDQIEEVIPKVVPEKAIEANIKALKLGSDSIRK
ncbi:MAG: 2-oxoacid:acceptor oxidoreductase family protein, partial [Candidatus Kariarchaeaceae archaeon]